jgi:anti-sigma-K factor RskA
MIDDSRHDLAALFALDLLEGPDRDAFLAEIGRDAELCSQVRELRATACRLAHASPKVLPPAELRARILASAGAGPDLALPSSSRTFRLIPILVPWAVAACLALAVAQTARLYLVASSETAALREQGALADIELRTVRNQLEAERIVGGRELLDVRSALADSADLARFKISTLASMLGNSPKALAVAVWDPLRQQGVIEVSRLPAAAADKDYQLWVIDSQYPAPVSAGVFEIDPATGGGHATFRTVKPIGMPSKFAVSLEPRGGSREPSGPVVLVSE